MPSERTTTIIRRVVALCWVAGAFFFAALFVYGLGLSGARGGWFWTALGLSIPAIAGFAPAWGRGGGRRELIAIIGVLAVLFGVVVARQAPLSHGRLWTNLDAIDLPTELRRIERDENGNALCLDACPRVTALYLARGSEARWERELDRILRRAGYALRPWRRTGPIGDQSLATLGTKGRLEIDVELTTHRLTKYEDGVPVDLDVPAGFVGLELSLTSD